MSKQQWGHGFHVGFDKGQAWAELYKEGEFEGRLGSLGERLLVISDAMAKCAERSREPKTKEFILQYMLMASKQIREIANELPSAVCGVYEFEKDVPQDDEPAV